MSDPINDPNDPMTANDPLRTAEQDGYEKWVCQTDSCVVLETLGHNRLGQPVAKELVIGPKARGRVFTITRADRLENQRMVIDPIHDPFRNGFFLRADTDQQADPTTRSDAALSTETLLDICELEFDQFVAKAQGMPEVPVRRLLEVALQMNIAHNKVIWLQEHIVEKYRMGKPQPSLQEGNKGERLSA